MPMSEHMSEPARARAGRALSKTFLSGFRYEIGNRAFVLRTMKRILGRLVGSAEPFLEQLLRV